MDTPPPCPNCGKPLAPNAPKGLCPECLLKGAFQTGPISGADDPAEPKGPRFVPPTVEELARQFPQLEILKFIGQGGMGAVYQARQKELDRIVALKILPPQVAGGAGFAERFAQEARALGKLNHPHIVTLYQFGQSDGLFYFLMEYVDGITLQQLMHSGRIAPREALAIVPQICDALQYAHQRGIVHRDIKPGNILLSKEGNVKIADFGVAKIVAEGLEENSASGSSAAGELTGAGSVLGTPQYMAPEQMDTPQEVDHRADIYSLGVVFYEMLTGELPSGKLEPPSARARGLQIDVRLDEVVLRALEKQPARRYQEADTMRTVVETIATTPLIPPSAPKPGPANTPRPPVAGPLPAGAFTGPGLKRTIMWVAVAGIAITFFAGAVVLGGIGLWRTAFRTGPLARFPFVRRVQASVAYPTPAPMAVSAPPDLPVPGNLTGLSPDELQLVQASMNQAALKETVEALAAAASNFGQLGPLKWRQQDLDSNLAPFQAALSNLNAQLANGTLLVQQTNLADTLANLQTQLAGLTASIDTMTNYDALPAANKKFQQAFLKLQLAIKRLQAKLGSALRPMAAPAPRVSRSSDMRKFVNDTDTQPSPQDLRTRFDAAQAIDNFVSRDAALAAVVKDAASEGDADLVHQALDAIAAFTKRDEATAEAARLLKSRGQRTEAIEIAKTMNNWTVRDQVLADLAK